MIFSVGEHCETMLRRIQPVVRHMYVGIRLVMQAKTLLVLAVAVLLVLVVAGSCIVTRSAKSQAGSSLARAPPWAGAGFSVPWV